MASPTSFTLRLFDREPGDPVEREADRGVIEAAAAEAAQYEVKIAVSYPGRGDTIPFARSRGMQGFPRADIELKGALDMLRGTADSGALTQITVVATTATAVAKALQVANDLRKALSGNRLKGRKIKTDFDEGDDQG